MNHVLFIIIEVVLVYLVLSYIAKKRNEKYLRTPVLIGIVIVLTLLPIESKLFSFKTAEQGFKYFYPTSSIVDKFDYKDKKIILYRKNVKNSNKTVYTVDGSIAVFKKEKDRWKYIKNFSTSTTGAPGTNSYLYIKKVEKNISFVNVKIKTEEKPVVEDSLGSTFIDYKSPTANRPFWEFYGIVENIQKGYYVKVNNETIRVRITVDEMLSVDDIPNLEG